VTRQQSQRRDLEAQDEQQSGLSKETESKLVNLQSLLRKLAYFNRATDEILRGNSKEAIIRQQTTLKTKVMHQSIPAATTPPGTTPGHW
jgi:hypothetical protein